MKKKVAFLLAATMVLAMPVSAFAATDEEIADIEAAVDKVNSAEEDYVDGNATYYETEDGEVTYEKNLGFIEIEKDSDGNVIMENEVVSDPDPDTEGEEGEKVISVPVTATALSVVTEDIENGYFTDVNEPSLKINPPTDSSGKVLSSVESYAVAMVDFTDNTVKWMLTGIKPDADGNVDVSMATNNDVPFAGLVEDGELHGYRIVVYALNDDITLSGTSWADLQTAIKGKIVGQTRIQGSYKG